MMSTIVIDNVWIWWVIAVVCVLAALVAAGVIITEDLELSEILESVGWRLFIITMAVILGYLVTVQVGLSSTEFDDSPKNIRFL